MEDRRQDGAGAIRDVGILPVERNAVGSEVPVPEAQRASTSWHDELLIERAVPARLRPGDIACQCRKSPTVHLVRADHGRIVEAVNHPGWEGAGFESAVYDYPGIALWGGRRCSRRSRRPALRRCGCWRRNRRCGWRRGWWRRPYGGRDIDAAPAIHVVWRTGRAALGGSDVNSRIV
jgi:hypothetical protein